MIKLSGYLMLCNSSTIKMGFEPSFLEDVLKHNVPEGEELAKTLIEFNQKKIDEELRENPNFNKYIKQVFNRSVHGEVSLSGEFMNYNHGYSDDFYEKFFNYLITAYQQIQNDNELTEKKLRPYRDSFLKQISEAVISLADDYKEKVFYKYIDQFALMGLSQLIFGVQELNMKLRSVNLIEKLSNNSSGIAITVDGDLEQTSVCLHKYSIKNSESPLINNEINKTINELFTDIFGKVCAGKRTELTSDSFDKKMDELYEKDLTLNGTFDVKPVFQFASKRNSLTFHADHEELFDGFIQNEIVGLGLTSLSFEDLLYHKKKKPVITVCHLNNKDKEYLLLTKFGEDKKAVGVLYELIQGNDTFIEWINYSNEILSMALNNEEYFEQEIIDDETKNKFKKESNILE